MRGVTLCSIIALLLVAAFGAAGDDKQSWDLDGVEELDIDGVSGDVLILPAEGSKGRVEVESRVRPSDAFEAVAKKRGKELRLEGEYYSGSSGEVLWTIYLPKSGGPSIEVSNASGDLECSDVTVDIDFSTASGDVTLSNVTLAPDASFSTASGDYHLRDMAISEDADFSTASGDVDLENLTIDGDVEFSSASGDVTVEKCKVGDDVEFSSASGNVEVRGVEMMGECSFSSASGDVVVVLDALPAHDFSASSASGDVTLKARDYGDDFKLVLVKHKDRGKIKCAFDFTSEEEFERHRDVYERKIVERGSGKPVIKLSTASGKVTVKK